MEDRLPEVDIVILSWNRAELTIDTIENAIRQKSVRSIIWVIDQGSDESQLTVLRNFIKSYPEVRLFEMGKNLGVPGGRNYGMKLGQAEYIVCIDNDAVFASDHALECAVQKFRLDETMAVVGFKILNYSTGDLDRTSWAYARQLIHRQDIEFLTTRFCGAGHAIRRSALEMTDYYDEALFFYWEELDLSYQLINLGYRICYYPEIRILHKISSENKVLWSDTRFYFLARNALYLNWKYNRSIANFGVLAAGYFIKGVLNGLIKPAVRGIIKSIAMISQNKPLNKYKLTSQARAYVYQNDLAYRGNNFSRIVNEVMTKLPAMD